MAKKLDKKVTGEEWERRKALDLPVTKELRYMRRKAPKGFEEIRVTDYVVTKAYETPGAFSLEITLETGEKVNILSLYFSEMQRPSFEKDMEEQLKAALEE